jgi:multidrug resistance efflux pump
VPVKIVFDDPPDPGHVLSLGMSVIPTVRLVDPDVPGK